MIILDGRKTAEIILNNLKKEIKEKNLNLTLAMIIIGGGPVSEIFVRQKEKACKQIGVNFRLFRFPSEIGSLELIEEIGKIAKDPEISGAVIQLPIPKRFNAQEILNLIPPEKDIDVLTEINLGQFYSGGSSFLPPVTAGIARFFEKYKISVEGKNVAIVGTGKLVGFPSALWFFQNKATVSVINNLTKDISYFTKKADIIVSGAGVSNLISGSMIKKGAVIIDAGSSVEKGKLAGDVDFKSVSRKAGYITPVPGGVGPLTVACLLENLVNFSKLNK